MTEKAVHLSKTLEVGTSRGTVEVELRRISSFEEYRNCEELQDLIWGADDIVRVTTLVMITAQNNGGMVIGAFVDGRPIGFVCAYPGLTETGKVKQCSQLMAVHPDFRGAKIGRALKLAQRQETLAQGLDLVTWTFDPLMSLNAHLNINRLGAVSSRYMQDFYGSGSSGLNGGLPTDRLLVEWWVDTPWVDGRLGSGRHPSPSLSSEGAWINEVVPHPTSGLPSNRRYDLDCSEPTLRLEIPERFPQLKQKDLGLAWAWRQETREIFETYLPRGYYVVHFDRFETGSEGRCGYVLRKWAGHPHGEMPPQLAWPIDSAPTGDVA